MRFAFLIMGKEFSSRVDRAKICNDSAMIVGVSNMDEAIAVAKELEEDGVECIELCGAFGEDNARRIIDATEGRIPIGHIVHLKEQDELYRKVFG